MNIAFQAQITKFHVNKVVRRVRKFSVVKHCNDIGVRERFTNLADSAKFVFNVFDCDIPV